MFARAGVKRRYAGRPTLFGALRVHSELPHSDPQQVRRLVRERIDTLGRGGGSILAMYDEARRAETRPASEHLR